MTNISPQNVDILKKYMDLSLNGGQKISFFLISGPKGIGKSQIAQSLSQEFLGNYFRNDFLHIKDFSFELQKQHNIKVEKKDDETYKTLYTDYGYQDIGTREINSWLQQSSAGKAKILLIENIERMSISAINAFLKTCEEPLPNRIILATTSNKSKVLETIISRSITISFDSKNFISNHDFTKDIENVVKILASDENIHNKHSLLAEINKRGFIGAFLDQLIANYVGKKDFVNAEKRIKVKKMSQTNVNMENLLFYGILD